MSAGGSQGRSFAEVLLSKPCSEEVYRSLKGRSSHSMDLFPLSCFEVGSGGSEQRLAVDCFEPEKTSPMAASSTKKTRGFSVKRWVKHLLGFIHSGMGPILSGLLEGFLVGFEGVHLRNKIRVVFKYLKGCKGFGLGLSLKPKLAGHPKPSCKVLRKAWTKPL